MHVQRLVDEHVPYVEEHAEEDAERQDGAGIDIINHGKVSPKFPGAWSREHEALACRINALSFAPLPKLKAEALEGALYPVLLRAHVWRPQEVPPTGSNRRWRA